MMLANVTPMSKSSIARDMRSDHSARFCAALALVAMMLVPSTTGVAQTRSVRDTTTAYGARLDAKGRPANTSSSRVNGRIDSRINNRLSLRIERYRPDSTDDPTAAYETMQHDKSRISAVIVPQQSQDDE